MPERTGYTVEEVTEKHIKAVHRSRELLEGGKAYRAATREELWRQSQRQYEGNHWDSTRIEDPTADLITVNVSFATVNTIIPYITSEEPRFIVEALSANATAKNARLQQAILNRQWRVANGQDAIRVAAEDYLVYGDGYGKTSWAITDKVREDGTVAEIAEIYVDVVSPWDVWIDPFSTSISDSRWVAQRILVTKREYEKDETLDQSVIDELPWGHWERDEDTERSEKAAQADESWIAIYEFYDRIDRMLYVFTESGPDKPLKVVEEIDCPISQLANYRIPQSPYHMGELEQLWPMQQELNKTRSQLITHRRRNIGKYFVRKGALGEQGMSALASPIINQAIEVLGDVPLDAVVKPAQLSALAPEAYNSSDQAMRDIYEISGVNEYLRGATPEIRRTATEASIIEGASNVKTRAKLADVERFARSLGEYMLAIMEEVFPETDVDELAMYLTGREAEQIARMGAAEEADELAELGAPPDQVQGALDSAQDVESVTVKPSAEFFVGEYIVEVEQGSTEMRNPVFKEQKYRELATELVNMSPGLAQMGVQVNLRKVLEMWFEAAGIADVEGMFEAAPQAAPGMMPGMDPAAAGGVDPMAGMLGAIGPQGTPAGMPNIGGVGAPTDPLTEANTGMMPPA